jgi:hypothetical protein
LNLFRRKQEPEPVPICTEQSPLVAALAAVQAADDRIATVGKEFRELVERYQIRVDRGGNVAFAIVSDVSFRAELESKVRRNLRDRDEALGEFYRALSVFAGLK